MRTKTVFSLLAACGAATAIGNTAGAQTLINVAGATLLENLIVAPALTNDYADPDANGVGRIFGTNQQLAPGGPFPYPAPAVPPFPGDNVWGVQYRVIGSVNGVQELVDFGRQFITTPDGDELFSSVCAAAYVDRDRFILNGVDDGSGLLNPANPGGMVFRSTMPAGFNVNPTITYSLPGVPSVGGYRHDIAPVDVPTRWAVQEPAVVSGGGPEFDRKPGDPGYGQNPTTTVNFDGTPNGFDHLLANLGATANIFDPMVMPNNDTIFDTSIAVAPVAFLTNLGTGIQQMDKSAMRWIFTTGRSSKGENLIAVTRDSGSGTRNAFYNSICIDPSWGIGENVGGLSVLAQEQQVGPFLIPGNCSGSGVMEATLQNLRLGVGYSGAERGVGRWLTGGRLEIIAVRNDLPGEGGVQYSRPTIADCLAFDANGWTIAGPAIFATFGDPQNENSPLGTPGNMNPAMRNAQAAALLNNMTLSIAAFAAAPGGSDTLFTPGEFIADRYIPVAAVDRVQTDFDPCLTVPNPNLNPTLQAFVQGDSVLGNPAFAAFGTVTLNGQAPSRYSGTVMGMQVTYTDEGGVVVNANRYKTQGGAAVAYGSNLTNRNRIAGDFNGDGLRNCNDATHMIAAWRDRHGGPAWVAPSGIGGAPGSDAVIEIIGDFDGDGNFDANDVRYWADGLAIDPNTLCLNRCDGFMKVDTAFGGNFFATSLANPSATYDHGDSVADVSNDMHLTTPGWSPEAGADGNVDANDIDYVFAQFRQNDRVADDELNWDNILEAIGGDLSADINGDMVVNIDDVAKIVEQVLETNFGDVDLDGDCDQDDINTATANLSNPGGWADGDVNGDGQVTSADVDIITMCATPSGCDGDADGNQAVNVNDISYVVFRLGSNPGACGDGDVDGTGSVNVNDISYVVFRLGTCNAGGPCN